MRSQPSSFIDRYVVIVITSKSDMSLHLYDTRQQVSWEDRALVNRSALKELIAHQDVESSDSVHAFVEYLIAHDTWSITFDAFTALQLAQNAGLRIFDSHFGSQTQLQIRNTGPLPLNASLIREINNTSQFAFEVAAPNILEAKISLSTNGIVYIKGQLLCLVILNPNIITILKRIKIQSESTRSRHNISFKTPLTDIETVHINELINEITASFNLAITLAADFIITPHSTYEKVLLVTYNQKDSTLFIRGAVDYGSQIVTVSQKTLSNPYVISMRDKTIEYAPSLPLVEQNVYETLSNNYGLSSGGTITLRDNKKVEQFLETHWNMLLALKWRILFDQDEIAYTTSIIKTDMRIDLDSNRDWLAFDLDLYCDNEKVRIEDIVHFIESNDELLKTADGRLVQVTNRADLERLVFMLERFSKNTVTGAYEGKLYNAPEIADIASNNPHYRAQFAKSFDIFMNEARGAKPVEAVVLPTEHEALLRPYQRDGVEWMHFLRKYHFAGILADEMGLGKTIQALSHISIHTPEGQSSLVVVPKTLLYNWLHEAQSRFPELSVAVIDGTSLARKNLIQNTDGAPRLLITSYPLLQRDIEWYKARATPFQYMFLDEAQSIKNPRTKNAHAVKAVPADYRIALTGTPLENNVEELWSIFDFLMPGFLGSFASFQRNFSKPIMDKGSVSALNALKSKTGCFVLRRTKNDVLKELPPKIESTVSVALNDDQNVLYQEVLARTKSILFGEVEKRGFNRSHIHILAALTKLRQICNHPQLVMDEGEYSSAKLDRTIEIVTEVKAEGRKVLIFSQFTSMLDIIAHKLQDEGISYSLLTGKTKNRQELVDAFNTDPSITVFLISLKAGGTGLNLASADTVIVFDPWWNPAVENQAIDRAHRMGQKKTVNVYRLVTEGTIEEKILALQHKKGILFDALVQENSELFKKLTWDDVQDIFR